MLGADFGTNNIEPRKSFREQALLGVISRIGLGKGISKLDAKRDSPVTYVPHALAPQCEPHPRLV